MNEEKKDVKKEEKTSEDSSSSKKTPDSVSEDVQNSQDDEGSSEKKDEGGSEDNERIAEELLSDKTSAKKEIRVKYEKFTEINEKAKLYDSFSPLLAKMKDDPEAAKKILGLGDDDKETIEKRVARLESEIKEKQRQDLKGALMDAIRIWPDIKQAGVWDEMQPIVHALEKQGVSHRNAIQRAYFATHPEAARKEEKLVDEQNTREALNRQGMFSSSSGYTKVATGREEDIVLSDADVEFAKAMNIDSKLYKKHAAYIKKFEDL